MKNIGNIYGARYPKTERLKRGIKELPKNEKQVAILLEKRKK